MVPHQAERIPLLPEVTTKDVAETGAAQEVGEDTATEAVPAQDAEMDTNRGREQGHERTHVPDFCGVK